MKINDVELEDLDVYDADVMEKYENVLIKVESDLKGIDIECKSGEIKISESIRKQCKVVIYCFDTLFGEGISSKIFNGKCNLLVCMKAFASLIEQMNDIKKYEELKELTDKYSPNRAQRRAKTKK